MAATKRILLAVQAIVLVALMAPAASATAPGGNGRLAYWCPNPAGAGDDQLCTIAPDGTNRLVLPVARNNFWQDIHWSEGSRRLAVGENGDFGSIHIVRADGSDRKTFDGHGGSVAWAPGGDSLAFSAAPNPGIKISRSDGSEPRDVTVPGLIVSGVQEEDVVADGGSDRDRGRRLRRLPEEHLANTLRRQRGTQPGPPAGPRIADNVDPFTVQDWSPDGRSILIEWWAGFGRDREDERWSILDVASGVYVHKPGLDGVEAASFSPDGQSFAVVKVHNGGNMVGTTDLGGSDFNPLDKAEGTVGGSAEDRGHLVDWGGLGGAACPESVPDEDFDGVADLCDPDDDNDAVQDVDDNCRLDKNPAQEDMDQDDVGDRCDLDIDGDGLVNVREETETGTDRFNPDTDGDALSDGWEVTGDLDGDGSQDLDLPALGADPRHQDIFVELDYMKGHRLAPKALQAVRAAFAAGPAINPDGTSGIHLHIDEDDEIPNQALPFPLVRSADLP